MPVKRPLERTSLRVVAGDVERCASLFPNARPYVMFREVINRWLNSVEAKAKAMSGTDLSAITIDLSGADLTQE